MTGSQAYVPGFKHDIFVSYAHVDNLPPPGVEEGWVTTFVKGLDTYLAQKFGRHDAYSLWMDPLLSQDTHLTPQIESVLHDAATLLVILSPGYLASAWCDQERNIFLKKFRAERAHTAWPVFIVEKDKVETRPDDFSDITGHPFWLESNETRERYTLGTPKPNPSDLRYYNKLVKLSEAIVTKLRQLKQHKAPEADSGAPAFQSVPSTPRPAVFLAEATEDLENEYNYVKNALMQAGLRVLPEHAEYPLDATALQGSVKTGLQQCTLFLQLLSALRNKGRIQLQYDQAVEVGLPILQWRNVNLNVSTISHEQYRALLQQDTVRTSSLDDLVGEALKRAQASAEAPPVSGTQMTVFLAEATEDLELEEERVRSDLSQAGFRLLREANTAYPREDVALFQHQVAQDIAQSDLFVQLLGSLRGQYPPDFVRLQYECAMQAGKPILQWRRPELDITKISSADLRMLLEGSTVYATGLGEFKSAVRNKLKDLQCAQAQSPVLRRSLLTRVFVNADKKDLELAEKVGEILGQQGLFCSFPWSSGEESKETNKIRNRLNKEFLECDALVIVYGSITPDWVGQQWLAFHKIQGQRTQPARALAVCIGPPPEKSKPNFVLPKDQVIDCRDGLNVHKFQPFLTHL